MSLQCGPGQYVKNRKKVVRPLKIRQFPTVMKDLKGKTEKLNHKARGMKEVGVMEEEKQKGAATTCNTLIAAPKLKAPHTSASVK